MTFAFDDETDKLLLIHFSKFPSTQEDILSVIGKLERYDHPQTVIVDKYSASLLWNLLVVFQKRKVKVLFSAETNLPPEELTEDELKELDMPNLVMGW